MAVVRPDNDSYVLVVSNISASDAGVYICIEDSGLGERHFYELIVTGKLPSTPEYHLTVFTQPRPSQEADDIRYAFNWRAM